MSRWIEQFNQPAYRENWENIKTILAQTKIDDASIFSHVSELARLKKVMAYLDSILDYLDPELIPINTWDSIYQNTVNIDALLNHFNDGKNISFIQNANAHADALLTFLRPYMIFNGDIAKPLIEAARQYQKTITENNNEILNKISEIKVDSETYYQKIKSNLDETTTQKNEIQKTFNEIKNDENGLYEKIVHIEDDAQKKYTELCNHYNETLIGTTGTPSTQKLILDAKEKILEIKEIIEEHILEVEPEIEGIRNFHNKIYGSKNVSENNDNGLSKQIDELYKSMIAFETAQSTKYKALNEEIESLLPGATSAGLATAYLEMKNSFKWSITTSSITFYISIMILLFVAFYLSIETIGADHSIKFSKPQGWQDVINSLLYKIPFYIPILWLAYFSSKRRSEYQRLQQEYAHKEALAKSYHSYKKQLEDLASNDTALLQDLISKTISAITYNSSVTLDGKHGEKSPIHELSEKSIKQLNDLAKSFTDLIGSIKK